MISTDAAGWALRPATPTHCREQVRHRIRASRDEAAWDEFTERVIAAMDGNDRQQKQARALLEASKRELREYLSEHGEQILAHFERLDRFEGECPGGSRRAAFLQEREWEDQTRLRREAQVWLATIDRLGGDLKTALWNLLDEEQRPGRTAFPVPWQPWKWTRNEQIDFAVMYGLTAIGLGLLLGALTRCSALAGATFMLFVVLAQPAWPGIYPPAPASAGHALVVNKDFIEMIALVLVAATPSGRWAGLDFFLPLRFRRRAAVPPTSHTSSLLPGGHDDELQA